MSHPNSHDQHSLSSTAIIDACKPFGRKETFAKVIFTYPELTRKVWEKWPGLVD